MSSETPKAESPTVRANVMSRMKMLSDAWKRELEHAWRPHIAVVVFPNRSVLFKAIQCQVLLTMSCTCEFAEVN